MPPSDPGTRHHPRTQYRQVQNRIPRLGKHVLVYDNCSVHQSTMRSQAPRPTSSRTSKTTSALRTTDVDPKEYDDLPPLSAFDDDEDDDARIFSRFQRESNSWLLFSGVLALIITLFIMAFTTTPYQRSAQATQRLLTAHLHERLRTMASEVGVRVLPYNLSFVLPPIEEPTFAREIQDVWVPALCYSSLVLTLIGAMVSLQVKHWLMACTMSIFPLSPPNPDPPSLRAAAVRFTEYKKSRKATVVKTAKIQRVVPPIMYGALSFFLCGVLVKVGAAVYFSFF